MSLNQFSSTYTALVSTLFETFGDEKLRNLNIKLNNTVKENNTEFLESIIQQWNQEILPVKAKINNRDASIFIDNISVLNDLNLPSLWISNKLSVNSKNYIWMYLSILTLSAEQTNVQNVDIKPPALSETPAALSGGIQDIYEKLPPNIMEKVKNIADEFGQKLESGETSITDLNFSELGQKLFSEISPDDMQNMMSNIGNMISSLNLDKK